MTRIVARTCTEFEAGRPRVHGRSFRLADLREVGAYVLLGAPGAGKTTLFRQEASKTGGIFESARNFMTLRSCPAWQGKTLFIDALDEQRSGSSDGRASLDSIRCRLDGLGMPRFRISCRDADWLGTSDWDHLKRVSPDDSVRVFHLDPLDQDGIFGILTENLRVGTAEEFVKEACDRGIDRLLENPLTLKLLMHATESSGWPKSRIRTFQQACVTLAREHNAEHQVKSTDRPDDQELLTAAGHLCTLELLTGRKGFSLGPAYDSESHIPWNDAGPEAHESTIYALQSRIFESIGANHMAPVHRHVAEFLAGRYLASKVNAGTPVSRVLALATGYDGHIVADLQGTSAWLAAHCKESRAPVIKRDPVGTLLYGDVSNFSTEEKTSLVWAIARHLERHTDLEELFHGWNPRLGDLASPEMANSFRDMLGRSDKDSTAGWGILVVLRALQVGAQVPGLADAVLKLVREQGRLPWTRSEALDAYVRQWKGSESYASVLLELLEDVWQRRVSDSEDELLGRLLTALYPEQLSAAGAVSYLKPPKNRRLHGAYWRFWNFHIAEESGMQRIPELLDAFADKAASIRSELEGRRIERFEPVSSSIRHLPLSLLARYVKSADCEVEPSRLLRWLGLVSDIKFSRGRPDDRQTVLEWLAARPDIVKCVFRIVVKQSASAGKFEQVVDSAQLLLLDLPYPPDFDQWCLDQGRRETDAGVARVFNESASTIRRRDPSHSGPEVIVSPGDERDAARDQEHEESSVGEVSVQRPWPPSPQDVSDPAEVLKREWRSRTRENLRSLREQRCKPAFLEGLAEVYFGNDDLTEGTGPLERLFDLLGDRKLVEAALAGLRGTVARDDMPTEQEVLRLHSQDRWHRLALPFLAGMEEIERNRGNIIEVFGRQKLCLALVLHYTTRRQYPAPHETAATGSVETLLPRWFRQLIKSDPGLVADALVRTVGSEVRKGLTLYGELQNLLQNGVYSEVARLASVRLLRLIPVRCTARQLDGLELILKAALLHCEENELQALVREKLGRGSMTVGQRVYWLAAGLFLDPHRYRQRLEQYICFDEERIRHLMEFMARDMSNSDCSLSIHSLDVESVEALVARGGILHRPLSPHTQAVWASALLEELIRQLGNDPSTEATNAFERLLQAPRLRPWYHLLRHCQGHQAEIRRNASFVHPSIEQVHQTLDNSGPANAADLVALTTDRLGEIAREIRGGSASLWQQFWNTDRYGAPETPKHEDRCRDLLLQILRDRDLGQLGVECQAEGQYADDKRADIRVSFGGFNIPIEIKKSPHRELWTAWRDQLVRKYARDPGSAGYGVYLVLWFGTRGVPPPPSGTRPRSASELRERLQVYLEADEQVRISIVVIDVAKPDTG